MKIENFQTKELQIKNKISKYKEVRKNPTEQEEEEGDGTRTDREGGAGLPLLYRGR